MSTRLNDARLWAGGIVPYEAADGWVVTAIGLFNRLVERDMFVARGEEADYVVFQTGERSSCVIGCRGGKQILGYASGNQTTLFHEMCHCLGLGHEQYNSGWPHRAELVDKAEDKEKADVHALTFASNVKKYRDVTTYDGKSIMLYSHNVLKVQPVVVDEVVCVCEPGTTLSPVDVEGISRLYPAG